MKYNLVVWNFTTTSCQKGLTCFGTVCIFKRVSISITNRTTLFKPILFLYFLLRLRLFDASAHTCPSYFVFLKIFYIFCLACAVNNKNNLFENSDASASIVVCHFHKKSSVNTRHIRAVTEKYHGQMILKDACPEIFGKWILINLTGIFTFPTNTISLEGDKVLLSCMQAIWQNNVYVTFCFIKCSNHVISKKALNVHKFQRVSRFSLFYFTELHSSI